MIQEAQQQHEGQDDTQDYAKEFGDYLKMLRVKVHGESIRDFAKRLGFSHGYLGRLELAQVGVPRRSTIIQMAEHLGTDASTLLMKAGYAPLKVDKDNQEFEYIRLKMAKMHPALVPVVGVIIDALANNYPIESTFFTAG